MATQSPRNSRSARNAAISSTSEARRNAALREEQAEQAQQKSLAADAFPGALESGVAADGSRYTRETISQGTADGGTITQSRLVGQTPDGKPFEQLTETHSVSQRLKDGSTRTLSESVSEDRAGRVSATLSEVHRTPDGKETSKHSTSYDPRHIVAIRESMQNAREGHSGAIKSSGASNLARGGSLGALESGVAADGSRYTRETISQGTADGGTITQSRLVGQTPDGKPFEQLTDTHSVTQRLKDGSTRTYSESVSEDRAGRVSATLSEVHRTPDGKETSKHSTSYDPRQVAATLDRMQNAREGHASVGKAGHRVSSTDPTESLKHRTPPGAGGKSVNDRIAELLDASSVSASAELATSRALSDARELGMGLEQLKSGGYTAVDLEVIAEGRTGTPPMQEAARLVLSHMNSADPRADSALSEAFQQAQAVNERAQEGADAKQAGLEPDVRSLSIQVVTVEGYALLLADVVREETPEQGLKALGELRSLSDAMTDASPAISESLREVVSQPVDVLRNSVELARDVSQVDSTLYAQAGFSAEQREAAAAPFADAAKDLLAEQGTAAQPAADSLQAVASALRTGDAQALSAAQLDVVAQVQDLAASVLEKTSERLDSVLAHDHREAAAQVLEVRVTETSPNLSNTAAYSIVNPQEFLAENRTPETRAEAAMPLEAAVSMLIESRDPAAMRAANSLDNLAYELRNGDASAIEYAQAAMVDEVVSYAGLQRTSPEADVAQDRGQQEDAGGPDKAAEAEEMSMD